MKAPALLSFNSTSSAAAGRLIPGHHPYRTPRWSYETATASTGAFSTSVENGLMTSLMSDCNAAIDHQSLPMYVRFSRKKKVNCSEHVLLGRQRPGGRSSANGVQLFGKQDGRHFRGKEAGRNAV